MVKWGLKGEYVPGHNRSSSGASGSTRHHRSRDRSLHFYVLEGEASHSAILDAHYLKRDGGLAESAIRKLESRTNLPTGLPTAG